MKPVVDRLRKAYEGKVDVRRMDTNGASAETEQLAQAFGIQYVPTFVFVDSKGLVRDTVVGETTEAALRQRLDALR